VLFRSDDWRVTSHTASIDLAWMPSEGWLLSLGYRIYHQSAAAQYQPFYLPMPMRVYYTSDKELTTLWSHRIELEVARSWQLDDLGTELRTLLVFAPSYFVYEDYPPIDHITALELTLALEARL
jgi:hypothetical protein